MTNKIVVISDDLVLNEKIIKALDYNYTIKFLKYSEKVIEELETFEPDLIIVDIISVANHFIDLTNEIENNSKLVSKKVIVLSQNKKIENIVGEIPKVKGYIKKPVDFEEVKKILNNIEDKTKPVIIIDDDADFLELIKTFIETFGYNVYAINDSRNAVETIKKIKPSILFLDLIMPFKDGFDIMNELLDDKETSNIPIIAITAMDFNKFIEKGKISNYPEYISRNLTPEFIKEVVENSFANLFKEEDEKIKILIADDQIELIMLMKESLEKAGFIVFTACDGEEVISQIYANNPDVAILDYDMPFKNGLQIATEIKNNPVYSHMPVIIMTAKVDKQTKIKGLMMGIDDYITKPVDNDELIARIRMIVKRNKAVLDTNPLSKLPGNPSIQARIEKAIEKNEKFAVLYVDLNNFKAYNDVYGFEAGDKVIKTLANILVKVVVPEINKNDFVGHIGGDDFIVVTSIDKAEEIAKKIINNFNQIVPSFYNEEDRKNGYIITKDRVGNTVKFPLLGVSIGIVHNLYKPLTSYAQISHIGSELKKAAKQNQQSSYIMDRRRE